MTQQVFAILQEPLLLRMWPLAAWVALDCLVAIWAAVSGRHWFLRALAVWAAAASMALIEAHDAVLFFTAIALLIVAPLLAARRWRSGTDDAEPDAAVAERSGRYRFHLRDVFLLMLAAGLWLIVLVPAVRRYQPENWPGFLAWVVGIAAIAVLAHLSVAGQRRWLWRGLLLCALPTAIAAVLFTQGYVGMPGMPEAWSGFASDREIAIQVSVLGAVWLLFLLLSLFLFHQATVAASRWRLVCGGVLTLGLAAALCPAGWIYWRLSSPAPAVARFEASPNHVRRILEIAERVERLNPSNISLADMRAASPGAADELESLYAELLPLLNAPNAIDYDPARDANAAYYEQQLGERVQSVRDLARCLVAESGAAAAAGRHDAAAEYALANMRLAAMLRRGGLVIDVLVSVAVERITFDQLIQLRERLSPEKARAIIAELDRSMAEHEDLRQIFARDVHFEEQAFGWRMRLENALDRLTTGAAPLRKDLSAMVNDADAVKRLLQGDLAIRLYRRETGRLPRELSDLTPGYLPAVPIDPFSNQPLRYRPIGNDFELYSVGQNAHDDGGTFTDYTSYFTTSEPGWDLNLQMISEK